MELIPAIDLLDGNVVRLHKGRYDQATVYSADPGAQARRFHEAGATRLHVVDLDGAKSGHPVNVPAIRAILRAAPVKIQIGGGIRDRDAAERWLEAGARRVVMGTAAVKHPELVQRLCEDHPGSVVVAIDSRGEEVAVEGWLEGSGRTSLDLARQADAWGVAGVLHTVIDRDGTREGPDVRATVSLQKHLKATVIASGGIGELAHIRQLADAGVKAAVCGRALYSEAFSLREAFATAAG